MKSGHVVVLGSGFRGLAAACHYNRKGFEVTVIEKADTYGGVLSGKVWNGLNLDFGCHLFDNTDARITEFIFDMVDDPSFFNTVEVNYASVYRGAITDGMAIPNLAHEERRLIANALLEMINHASNDNSVALGMDMNTALQVRFGKTITQLLRPCIEKVYASRPEELCGRALDMGLFRRVHLLPYAESAFLKGLAKLDERLSVPAGQSPVTLYPDAYAAIGRNFYPAHGGTRGFVERVVAVLKRRGVEFIKITQRLSFSEERQRVRLHNPTTASIVCDRVVATLSPKDTEHQFLGTRHLEALIRPVPMVLFYFMVPAQNIGTKTYIHNFDPGTLAFRISAPGIYGMQLDDKGNSFICVECPTTKGTAIWRDPESFVDKVWEEVLQQDFVAPSTQPYAVNFLKTPQSYSVALAGYHEKEIDAFQRLKAYSWLKNLSGLSFAKNDIIREVLEH